MEQMRVLMCDAYVGMANLTSCSIAVTAAALHLTVLNRVISDRDLAELCSSFRQSVMRRSIQSFHRGRCSLRRDVVEFRRRDVNSAP